MKIKKALCVLLSVFILCQTAAVNALSGEEISQAKTYSEYKSTVSEPEGQGVTLDMSDASDISGEFEKTAQGIKIDEEGFVDFAFGGIKGNYKITLVYDVIYGRSRDIEINLLVNDTLPFREAAGITLKRRFRDKDGKISQDINGNDIRPEQVEIPFEERGYLRSELYDSAGLVVSPLVFFLHTNDKIKILSSRETIIIHEIIFEPFEDICSYEEYKAQFKNAQDVTKDIPEIEAEIPLWKSDSVLTAASDRISPMTSPYKGSKISLNMIGSNWNSQGQVMAWKVTAGETGFYELRMRVRQNYSKGFYSARTLRINGEIPFAEAENLTFLYNSGWASYSYPYKLYFEKGKDYEISLGYTIGDFAGALGKTQLETERLNRIYSDLLMVMGSTPDTMRDYHLEKVVPQTLAEMAVCAKNLEEITKDILKKTKFSGGDLAPLNKTAIQLREFTENPAEIAKRLRYLKDNIASLNTWIIDAKRRPLDIDFLQLASPDSKKTRADANIFQSMAHAVKLFFASFFEDYNALAGAGLDNDVKLKVWSTQGRDQAQVLNDIIRTDYTLSSKERTQKNIGVSLEVVAADAILPSTAVGNGPDILMHAGMQMPVNYAARKAVTDLRSLSSEEEIAEILSRFRKSAVVPFEFEGGLYGLPESQTFPLMFLRTDILARLNIKKIPETWDEIIAVLPILQKKNMTFLMDTGTSVGADISMGMSTFTMFLYQRGGRFYKENGAKTDLDSEISVDAFKFWTRFYTSYGLPTNFDIANRFRTGESPIVLSDLTLYNQLTVSAPEIKGLWEIAAVPGTVGEDGTINRSVRSSVSASMIFESSNHKAEAWDFIKWWTDKKTQQSFSKGMESLLGASARYPTANIEALAELPWTVRDFKIIEEQAQWAVGVEEVLGGYYTPRHINNAFRLVAIERPGREGTEPREAILQYSKIINDELYEKRKEFAPAVSNSR